MSDIIIYDYYYFLNIKNTINNSNIEDNLKNKITDIFNTHQCFNLKNKVVKNRYTSKPKLLENKTDDKIILSYLNKITNKNYEELSTKIIKNITNYNYTIIFEKLLEISYKQPHYSNLYIKLYKRINNFILEEKNNILLDNIYNFILEYSNNIINNKNNDLNLIIKHVDKKKLDYNDFCDINKNSKHLKGKINIICYLIKYKIINIDKNYLIDNLFKYENYDNEIFLELLQIINNILVLDNDKIDVLREYIKTSDFKGKMMIKFKLKDIIDNKKIKDF
jgi:hypothetical protein|tara:strand:- start:1967 stop:2800 length:834 start_codon:yes stop_codon:yes gene_type:complete